MEYMIDWIKPGRVLRVRMQGTTDPIKLIEFSDDLVKYIDGLPEKSVHLLVDFTTFSGIQANLTQASSATRFFRHPALGWFLFINNQNVMRRLVAHIMTQTHNVSFREFETLDEAIQFLQQKDNTLDSINLPDA